MVGKCAAKSITEELLYDCCFAFGGLAKKAKLAQCSEEEISLAEMREQGLCHYIGKRSEDFAGLWKSREDHIYCCFSTKLARIFQEEARNQLNMDWGDAKHPDCRGLSFSEIENIDFTKIDLSEMCNRNSQDFEKRLQQKMENIQPKLKQRIEQEKSHAKV